MRQIHAAGAVLRDPGPNASEHLHQAHFVSWWRKSQGDIIFAIPNGGKRGHNVARQLKAEGVLSGVWDLCVPERGLWIEFKRADRGTLSKAQKDFGERMRKAGYTVMVAWGAADALHQLENGIREDWKRPR